MEEVTKENVMAGTPMIRRAMFQFGGLLPKGPRGQVDAGLGKVTSRGTVTLIPPTQTIREPIEVHVIDGVEMVFQLAPDTEAPAEMHMFYPGLRALNLAENATHNLHNIYPIRGAQVRDANAWAKYLNQARDRFAVKADVVFAQHHWPVWGNGRVLDYLAKQRDTYKYLHDQTLRLMSHGLKAGEIAERLAPPQEPREGVARARLLRHVQPQRQGRVSAVSRLVRRQPRQPRSAASSGAREEDGRLHGRRGRDDRAGAGGFRQGRIPLGGGRHEPGRVRGARQQEARELGADALEQLGYQSESATWRNAYLQGARELRDGMSVPADPVARRRRTSCAGLSLDLFFDFLGVRLNGAKAEGKTIVVNWEIADTGRALRADPAELRADLPGRPSRRGRRRHRHARPPHPQPHRPARAGAARGGGRRVSSRSPAMPARSPTCSPCSTISPSPSMWSSRCARVRRSLPGGNRSTSRFVDEPGGTNAEGRG